MMIVSLFAKGFVPNCCLCGRFRKILKINENNIFGTKASNFEINSPGSLSTTFFVKLELKRETEFHA